jgi:hypothetical protein
MTAQVSKALTDPHREICVSTSKGVKSSDAIELSHDAGLMSEVHRAF